MKSDIRIWHLIIIQLGEGYMKYSAKTKPGMGDPYWYEWSVGQQYIIDMLNSDNNINVWNYKLMLNWDWMMWW